MDGQEIISATSDHYKKGMAGLLAPLQPQRVCTPYFDNLIIAPIDCQSNLDGFRFIWWASESSLRKTMTWSGQSWNVTAMHRAVLPLDVSWSVYLNGWARGSLAHQRIARLSFRSRSTRKTPRYSPQDCLGLLWLDKPPGSRSRRIETKMVPSLRLNLGIGAQLFAYRRMVVWG